MVLTGLFGVALGVASSCAPIQVPAAASDPAPESTTPPTSAPTPAPASPDRPPASSMDAGAEDATPVRDTVYVIDTVPAKADTPVYASAMYDPVEIDPVLERRVAAIVDAPRIGQLHWGILARDMHDGRVIYQRNAHRKFTPASTMKALTAAAALTRLGPEFRYETALWSFGELDGSGVLRGPLVLDGRGDPTLSDRFHESGRAALAELARRLRANGVRRVEGPLVIDASRWDSTSAEGTWMVEDVGWSWAAGGAAFAVDEGAIDVIVMGGNQPGDPAGVDWPADLDPERFDHDVTTTAVDTIDLTV